MFKFLIALGDQSPDSPSPCHSYTTAAVYLFFFSLSIVFYGYSLFHTLLKHSHPIHGCIQSSFSYLTFFVSLIYRNVFILDNYAFLSTLHWYYGSCLCPYFFFLQLFWILSYLDLPLFCLLWFIETLASLFTLLFFFLPLTYMELFLLILLYICCCFITEISLH